MIAHLKMLWPGMSLRRSLRLGLVCYCILSSLSMPAVIAFPTMPGAIHPDCKCHLKDRMAGTCCCSGKSCCGKPKPAEARKSCCSPKSDTSLCCSTSSSTASAPEADDDDEMQLNPCGCGSPVSQGGLLSSDPRLINTRSRLEGPAALITRSCEFQMNWTLYTEAPATPPPEAA